MKGVRVGKNARSVVFAGPLYRLGEKDGARTFAYARREVRPAGGAGAWGSASYFRLVAWLRCRKVSRIGGNGGGVIAISVHRRLLIQHRG